MVISKKYEYSSKVDIKELQKWFPSLSRQQDPNVINSGAASFTASLSCKMLVICFPNAGSDESMYTSEGTAMRKIHSPLLEWAAQTSHGEKNAEILAVQLPGRGFRSRERVFTSAQSIAVALLQVLAPLLFPQRADSSTARHVPYAVIGHSLGALLAFEFISLCRDEGFALPIHAFLSSFPSPDTPIHLRPWRVNKHLDDAAFQQECRCWERTNEVIFSKSIWPTLVQQLRADFTIFDTYEFGREKDEPLECPVTFFYAKNDKRVTPHLMQNWRRRFYEESINKGKDCPMTMDDTTTPFLQMIDGNHLFPISEPQAKVEWLQRIVTVLQSYM